VGVRKRIDEIHVEIASDKVFATVEEVFSARRRCFLAAEYSVTHYNDRRGLGV